MLSMLSNKCTLQISSEENDGLKLFDKLCCLETPEEIRDLFSKIEGP